MKKFLSLVLALIMTMSLVTIGAGATEYRDLTDKDEIQYEEAVAVLNRIGVITGYEDGSFRPETELTRGAAAKIIVSLLIGPEAAANLPNATAPYPGVPASHTFAGVISYCKTAGIISGYGDGTFKPANSLTGFAFAKMLLGALGYKSEIEGFVDTGWTMNVARIGNVTGLFDRLDFDGSAAVNRETACQLALNTLKATMVTYGGTTLVTGAQALAVQGTQAMYVTSNNREINANINRRVISAANNEMTLEFGEEHFKDLRLEHDKYDPAYDEYGHPSNEWSWKKVTIGTFKLPANFTYTKQMSHLEDTDATKEKALGLRNYDTWSIDHRAAVGNWSSPSSVAGLNGAGVWKSPFDDATQITINGWDARVNDKDKGRLVSYDASVFNNQPKKPTGVPTIAEIADLTDNGVTVEVYVCPVDADFITNVVVTRTQLMKVKRIGSDFVTLEDIKPDSRGPRDDNDLKKITGYNAFAIDVTEKYDLHNSFLADVKDSNYDAYNALKDMKVGDYVAVVPYSTDEGKTWEVGEAYAPETVSGAFTKVDTYANVNKPKGSAVAITVGGTSYPINEWNKDLLDVTGAKIKATKKDVTLYLAKDGTVLWADEVGNSDAWMVVGDYYQATSAANKGKIGWFVHGWTIGGEEVDLDLGTIRGDAEKYAPGELVYYNIAEEGNGEYVLSKPSYSKKGDTKGWNHYKDGTDAKDDVNLDGEGVYEVSQYTFDAADSTMKTAKQYQINKRNGALALENYNTDTKDNPPVQYTLADNTPTVETDDDKAPGINAPVKHVNKTNATNANGVAPGIVAHEFKYSNLLYDGVKFIFVNFDAANGEVETIDFKSGVQNVDYQDLVRFNKYWKNIGTNDGQKFVLSAAEAYVNDKGLVKAVVIKSDSAEADLSKIAVITDTPGDKNWQKSSGAEGDRTDGMSYAKRYVTGPSFSMAEEKTGYFDKDYPIGTILVITEKENYIVGKYFHSSYYNNGNPDAVWVKGITALKNIENKNSEAGFLIGQPGSTVWTLDEKNQLTYDGVKDPEVVPGEDRIVDLLGDKFVSGYDTYLLNGKDLKGLVKVDKNTTFVDLRAINTDTIDDLGDLLDYDLSTVELRLLVNGNDSTDTFRHAYAVIVEKAVGKKDSVAQPGVKIEAVGTTYDEASKENRATVGSQVVLTAKVTDALTTANGISTTYQWYQVINGVTQPITGATSPIYVVSPVVLGPITYKVVVTNTDTNRKDVTKLTAEDTYTITGVTAQAGDTLGNVTIKPGEEKGANSTSSGANIDADGSTKINFNLKMPTFVPDGATATIGYDVKVNGQIMKSVANYSLSKVGNGYAAKVADDDLTGLSTTSNIQVVVTSITYNRVTIKYEDASGADITAKMAGGTSTYADTTAADITIKYPSTDAVNFPVISVKSGLTTEGTITQPSALTGGVTADGKIENYAIKGTEGVVIKIDASKVAPSFTLSLGDNVKAGATALSEYGVKGSTDGAKTITVALGSNATSMKADSVCIVTISKPSGALTESFSYTVEMTLDDGQVYTKEGADVDGTNPMATFSVKNIKASTKITKLEVIETPKLAATAKLNDAKNTLTITFNTPVKASTVTTATLGIALGTQTVNNDDVVDIVVSDDGLTATVTVANATKAAGFKPGSSLNVTGGIESLASTSNKTTAGKLIDIPA